MLRLRRAALAVVVSGSALLLSGCLNLDVTTNVSSAGTFTGEYTTTIDRAALKDFGAESLDDAKEQLGAGTSNPKVQVSWSETDTEFVQTVTFTDATADEIDAAMTTTSTQSADSGAVTTEVTSAFPLQADADGEVMVVELADEADDVAEDVTDSPGKGSDPLDKQMESFIKQFFADSTIEMTITMPGPIASVTGAIPDGAGDYSSITVDQVDERTVELRAGFVDMATLSEATDADEGLVITSALAEAGDPTTAADPATGESSSGGVSPGVIAGGIALLAALVVGVVLFVRRRPGGAPPADPGA